jgi:ABC-type xylose transport system permease subunit
MVQYQWMTRSRLLKPRVVKVVVVDTETVVVVAVEQ